jgi:hypothetical protein
MMDNISILRFQTFHIKFKVIMNLEKFKKFQSTYTNLRSNENV